MKITILDDYQDIIRSLQCFEILKDQEVSILHEYEQDVNNLANKLENTQILVLTRERTTISEGLLSRLPNLKLISQTGKISNHLNLALCTKYKVAVAEGVGSPIAPAELTWALIMNTTRMIPQAIESMKNGMWQTNIGSCIYGKTIGIWGYGKIGQKIAQYAKAFDAKVLVWGSENSMEKAVSDGFEKAISKEYFFEKSDIISLHLRLHESTNGIVKESDLMRMKDYACLINTARAELIEKEALNNALKYKENLFVGLDVYDHEPIYDKNFHLFHNPHVVCTPHLGYVEKSSYELYFGKAFENIIHYINGKPCNIANPEVL